MIDTAKWPLSSRDELNVWRMLVTPTDVRFALLDRMLLGEEYCIMGLYEVMDGEDGATFPRPALAVDSRCVVDGALRSRGWFLVADANGVLTVYERRTMRLVRDKALAHLVHGWLQGTESRPQSEPDKLAGGDAGIAQPVTNRTDLAADGADAATASRRNLLLGTALSDKGKNANLSPRERVRHMCASLLSRLLLCLL